MSRVGMTTVIDVFLYSSFRTVIHLDTHLPDSLPDNWLPDKLPSSVDTFITASKAANSLLEEKIQTPEFHLLSKIHKANNPGEPVISSVNYHISITSEFVDYYFQPEVKKLKILR